METANVHMNQTRNNINSTKTQDPKRQEKPPMTPLAQRTNAVFNRIVEPKQQIATDLSVKFPVTSNMGNKYIFLLYR